MQSLARQQIVHRKKRSPELFVYRLKNELVNNELTPKC